MRMIQSFWTKPSTLETPLRRNGGWISQRYHHMSMALSCLQLKQFYDAVELYTDTDGKKLLVDQLKLPFTKVTILDNIDLFNDGLFSLSKLMSLRYQNDAFLHVDGDVFIWRKFPEWLEDSSVVVQSKQIRSDSYNQFLHKSIKELSYVPPYLFELLGGKNFLFCNNGIVGGCNIAFFQSYHDEAYRFIVQNRSHLKSSELHLFNALWEEILLTALASVKGVEVKSYIQDVDQDYFCLTDFNNTDNGNLYVHLIGTHKQYLANCKSLESKLHDYYPDYFNEHFRN